MSETASLSALQEFLRFPFREGQRGRFLIGVGLVAANVIIPILPLIFAMGYLALLMRPMLRGKSPALPPWEDWGRMALDGLQFFGINLIYMLPGTLVMFFGMALYFGASMTLPFLDTRGDSALLVILLLGSMGVMFLSLAVGMVLMALGAFPLPMALAHFVERGEFGAAFRLREIFKRIRQNLGTYAVAWVIVMGVGMLFYLLFSAAYLSMVLCCFLPVINGALGFYLLTVAAALFARAYYESQAQAETAS